MLEVFDTLHIQSFANPLLGNEVLIVSCCRKGGYVIGNNLCIAAEAIVLAFQHYLTMVGTAVLIPLLIFQTDTGLVAPVSRASSSLSNF